MDIVTFLVVALILAATTIVLSELLRPKPKFENARPAGLGDFNFPTATEERVVPLIWGTVRIAGPNVVWYGDLRQEAIKKKIKTGLWSSSTITTAFKYFIGIQFGLCRGPISRLSKIWIGEKLAFSGLTTTGGTLSDAEFFGGNEFGGGGIGGSFSLVLGSETQGVNSYLATLLDPLPAYRGTSYLTWEGGYIGNSTSIRPWAFEVARFIANLGLTGTNHIVNDHDANPAEVLYEILTDTDWGFGFPASRIDLASFQTAGETLFDEGNGFSMVLDRPFEARELIREVLRQIDGLIFLDHQDGKFHLTLARGDYDIGDVFQVSEDNIVSINDFTRGSWDETVNQVRVQFKDRARDYQGTYAVAEDLANERIQNGELISTTASYPGVKDRDLAARLASRGLKNLSTPLAKAEIVVDRSAWNVKPGDVVAWTDEALGFQQLAMRVIRVDYGDMEDGRITLGLVQDVFRFAAAFVGSPEDPFWTPPDQGVEAFPADEQLAMEAPWAIVRRDPDSPGVMDRLWAAGRRQTGSEITFRIYERHSAGTPSGAFSLVGEVFGFMQIGKLRGDHTANATTISVDPDPDTIPVMQSAFTPSPSPSDIGQNLINLLMIDGEFILATTTIDQTTHMDLTGCYRGAMDTAQTTHDDEVPVYLLSSAGMSDSTIPATHNVHVKLRPRSRTEEVAEGSAVTISLTMNNRARRPYPPAALDVNGDAYPTDVDLDEMSPGGTTEDDRGLFLEFIRRDYRTFDEVAGIGTDAETLDPSFPAFNTTEYSAEVIDDPDGTPTSLLTTTFDDPAEIFVSRTEVLRATDGVIPTRLRVEITARHTYESVVREALQVTGHSFDVDASPLDDDFNLGARDDNVNSNVWTVPTTGTYNFAIAVALSTGAVEAKINAGAFAAVITAGNTTGSLPGVTAGDTITVRHTQTGSGSTQTFLSIDAPSSSADAYGVLII